jgi:hypothetical protein
MVTIREDGTTRRVTAAEAFLLKLTKSGLEGDSAAARASLAAIEHAREQHNAGLALQLFFSFEVRPLSGSLVSSTPE